MKKQEIMGCLPLKQTAIYTTQKGKNTNKNCQSCREVRKYEEKELKKKKIHLFFSFLRERKNRTRVEWLKTHQSMMFPILPLPILQSNQKGSFVNYNVVLLPISGKDEAKKKKN